MNSSFSLWDKATKATAKSMQSASNLLTCMSHSYDGFFGEHERFVGDKDYRIRRPLLPHDMKGEEIRSPK